MASTYSSSVTWTSTDGTVDPGKPNENTTDGSPAVTPRTIMLLTATAGVLIMTLLVSIISLFISFRRARKTQDDINRRESSMAVEPIAPRCSAKNSISKPLNQKVEILKNPDLKTRSLDRPTAPPPQPPVGGSVKQPGERLFIPRSHMPNAFRRSRLPTAPPPPGDQSLDATDSIETAIREDIGNVTLHSIDVIQEELDGDDNS